MIAYDAWGDCCSETWFADITGVGALIGGTVRADEVSMDGYNVEDSRTGRNATNLRLQTDHRQGLRRHCFRNSSNGYYGGSIELLKRELPEGMIAITDDWQA